MARKFTYFRNLFGSDPLVVDRFFSQLEWRKKGKHSRTRYISAVCRRNLDRDLAASYAAVNKDHDTELKKIDYYFIGADGRLMIELTNNTTLLHAGRPDWLHNCKSLSSREVETSVIPHISRKMTVYTLTAEDYLFNHVFGHDLVHKPFVADLIARLEQFAVKCNASSKDVLGVHTSGQFAFRWTTEYNSHLGPHVDSEPSLLIHVGGELPDGTQQSRGAGVLSTRNIGLPNDNRIINLKRVSYLRPGDFAICAGGFQGRLSKSILRGRPNDVGGLHTNSVRNTGHPKEPVLPEGSTRRSLISYALTA